MSKTVDRPAVTLVRSLKKGHGFQYGIWPDEQEDSSLEKSQERLLAKLFEFLPSSPARILVVGCGQGWAAFEMAQRGHTVTAIDSSQEFIEEAVQKYGSYDIDFFALDFCQGDLSILSAGSFDVLFFHEFSSHFDSLDTAVDNTRRLLKDQGIVIISDEVGYDNSVVQSSAIKAPSDFVVSLSEHGFCITKRGAIAGNVKNTCYVIVDMLQRRLNEIMDSVDEEKIRNLLQFWRQRKTYWDLDQIGFEVFAAKKDRFFMRSYAEGDEKEILSLFKECFQSERTPEHWKWKFKDNPYGSLKIALATDEMGEIAAHYAGYPVPFSLLKEGDKDPTFLIGYQNGDTMTRPGLRNVGLGRTSLLSRVFYYFIAKFCEENLSFYYGFNTGKVKILGQRYLGYNYIHPVTFWVRDLIRNPLKKPNALTRLFPEITTEEVNQVNGEWDAFFERVRPFYKLLVHRDPTYLNWRYLSCPDFFHRMFALRKKGKLIGWSVFRKEGKKLVWGDALFDKLSLKYLNGFLKDVVSRFYTGIEEIEAWFSPHPRWWSRKIEELGFVVEPEPSGLTPCAQNNWRNNPEKLSVLEREESIFYYSKGDSDLF